MAYQIEKMGVAAGSPHDLTKRQMQLGATRASSRGKSVEDFQEMMLNVRAFRQQVIASSIANADTPGYRAMDVDMAEAVAQSAVSALSLSTSSSLHFRSGNDSNPLKFVLKYRIPYQANLDGNTVEMDIERQKFSENALMYQFSLDRVSGEIKHTLEMLKDLK